MPVLLNKRDDSYQSFRPVVRVFAHYLLANGCGGRAECRQRLRAYRADRIAGHDDRVGCLACQL